MIWASISLEKKGFLRGPNVKQESNRTPGNRPSETVVSSCTPHFQEQTDPVLLPLSPNWRVGGVGRAHPLQHSQLTDFICHRTSWSTFEFKRQTAGEAQYKLKHVTSELEEIEKLR